MTDLESVRTVLESDLPNRGAILALMAVGLGNKRWKEICEELV